MSNVIKCSVLPKVSRLLWLLFILGLPVATDGAAPGEGRLDVSLGQKKARRGEKVEITIQASGGSLLSGETVRAVILRPTVGEEALPLLESSGRRGVYR